MRRSGLLLAFLVAALVAGCSPPEIEIKADVENKTAESRLVWLSTVHMIGESRTTQMTRTLAEVKPREVLALDFRVRHGDSYTVAATDSSGDTSRFLASTGEVRSDQKTHVKLLIDR